MTNKTTREILHETALKAPHSSGVYLWRNSEGTVIYVGKAKNLKNRLSSYFSGKKDIKTKLLISNAFSIEYITTTNEYEALLLENNLIKKYNPRYNICLKDGKSYPVLRITNEEFPKLFKTRRVLKDGSTYYGPFPDVSALDNFIESIFKLYPIRHCRTLRKRDTPCLYYHMKQCKAPCCNKISKQSYNDLIGEIKALLEGKDKDSILKLTEEMKKAASELNFEKAARLRDGIKALSVLQKQNIVETFDSEDKDYISYFSEGELVSFTVLKIRQGKLLGRENYRAESLNDDNDLIGEFLACYYENKNQIPPSIFIPKTKQFIHIAKWLKDEIESDSKLIIVLPSEKNLFEDVEDDEEKELLSKVEISTLPRDVAAIQMAFQNAKEDIVRRVRERGDMPAMEELKNRFDLPTLPIRIEGFDIAHIGGKFPVASMISFYNGNPDKKNYRYFRLKTTDGIIDDFASMREAVTRRYTKLLNEQEDLPDLILIDGGIGQVNAAEGILQALDLDIPVIGLAEKNEEIYLPGNSTPIVLPRRSDALRLLQRVRDETHRFATSKNQQLRTKENVSSPFLLLPGVGQKRAHTLQIEFGSLEELVGLGAAVNIGGGRNIGDGTCIGGEAATGTGAEVQTAGTNIGAGTEVSSHAQVSRIMECIKVSKAEAQEIISVAKDLLDAQKEKQSMQKLSLGISGTTKEKAAQASYLNNLAAQALALQGHKEVAEKEAEYGGREGE